MCSMHYAHWTLLQLKTFLRHKNPLIPPITPNWLYCLAQLAHAIALVYQNAFNASIHQRIWFTLVEPKTPKNWSRVLQLQSMLEHQLCQLAQIQTRIRRWCVAVAVCMCYVCALNVVIQKDTPRFVPNRFNEWHSRPLALRNFSNSALQ